MTQRRIEAGFLDAVAAYFHHATPGLGPKLETAQNAEWGRAQGTRAVATMHAMDAALATRPYLAGEHFTVADITALAGFAFAGFAKIETPPGLAHLAAWRARVDARPSVQQAA